MRTWEICFERALKLQASLAFFRAEIRELVHGISTILEAYRSGDLTYSVMVAQSEQALCSARRCSGDPE